MPSNWASLSYAWISLKMRLFVITKLQYVKLHVHQIKFKDPNILEHLPVESSPKNIWFWYKSWTGSSKQNANQVSLQQQETKGVRNTTTLCKYHMEFNLQTKPSRSSGMTPLSGQPSKECWSSWTRFVHALGRCVFAAVVQSIIDPTEQKASFLMGNFFIVAYPHRPHGTNVNV